jgi:hypothetical protein
MENLLHKNSAKTVVVPTKKPVEKEPAHAANKNILASKYAFGQKTVESPKKNAHVVSSFTVKKVASTSPQTVNRFHFHLLIFAALFYAAIFFIFWKVEPATIQNFIVPNTYLPLLAAFFCGNFFLGSFLFNNTRRGFSTTIILSIWLFLQLQQILSPILMLGIVIPFGIFEGAMMFTEKK